MFHLYICVCGGCGQLAGWSHWQIPRGCAYFWSCCLCVAVCCSVLQCVAVCCSVLQCAYFRSCCHVIFGCMSRLYVCCSVLICVEVCCSAHLWLHVAFVCVLQCVAVCCSVLQRVAVPFFGCMSHSYVCVRWVEV